MEKRVQQEASRGSAPPKRAAREAARQQAFSLYGMRAISIFLTDKILDRKNIASLLRLGAHIGNHAMSELLASRQPVLSQPFTYRPPVCPLKPFAVRTVVPALCKEQPTASEGIGTTPFPISSLVGSAEGQVLPGALDG